MNQDDKPTGKSQTSVLPPIQEATKSPKKKISGDLTAASLLHSITQEKKLPQNISHLNTALPEKKEPELSSQDIVLKPESSFDKISDIRSERHQRSARSSILSIESKKSQRLKNDTDLSSEDIRTSESYFSETARTSQMFGRRYQKSDQLVTNNKHPLDDLDPAGIVRAMKDLQRKVQHLKVENEIFYKFLQENDSEAIKEMAELQEKRRINADRVQAAVKKRASRGSVVSTTNLGFGASGPRGSIASLGAKPRTSVASITGRPRASLASFSHFESDLYSDKEAPKIILAQKLDMIMKCMEEFEKHLETARNQSKKAKRTLLSNLEEMEIRNEEIQESREHFAELRNNGVTLEKFVRFFEEWLKKSRLTGDKIRLRHSSLKVQYHKAATLLANKKLIGEHVQEVDFDQLRVENRHLTEHIESKNCLLIEMKKMTASGNLKLTQLKKFLQEKMAKKEALLQSIKTFEDDIMRSDEQLEKLYKELDQVRKKYDQCKERSENYLAPDVLEYIRKKADVDNAKKELKVWERRKMLKELALSIAITEMKRIFRCTHTHPSWFK